MGFAKRHAEYLESRGLDEIEGDVCLKCIDDEHLEELIELDGRNGVCTFCERSGTVAAADDVAGEIVHAFYSVYCDPVDEMPIDGGEFVELSPFKWTEDAFDELCSSAFSRSGDSFYEAVLAALPGQQWVEIAWRGDSQIEIMRDAWQTLSLVSRFERRYFFHSAQSDEPFGWSPSRLLEVVASLSKRYDLVRSLPQETKIYRSREHNRGESPNSANQLGTPPTENARANRMSPQGIAMFYGAMDRSTALAETAGPRTTAAWVASKSLSVLDLSQLPAPPSPFNSSVDRNDREGLLFLQEFRDELRKPISRDGQEGTEYVPTQVVTEFFRVATPVQGIMFPSSRCDGDCCVLFFGNGSCVDASREEHENVDLVLLSDSIKRHT